MVGHVPLEHSIGVRVPVSQFIRPHLLVLIHSFLLSSFYLFAAITASSQGFEDDSTLQEMIGIAGKDFVYREFKVKLESSLGKGGTGSTSTLTYPWFVADSLKFLQPIIDSFTISILNSIGPFDSSLLNSRDVYMAFRAMDDRMMWEYHHKFSTGKDGYIGFGPDLGRGQEVSVNVEFDSTTSLVTVRGGWSGMTGGVHPNSVNYFMMLDSRSGKRVYLKDMFTEGYATFLDSVGTSKLDSIFHVTRPIERRSYDDHEFSTSSKFTVDSVALRFKFSPYEVSSYRPQGVNVDFPYSILQPFIRPDGPLGRYKKGQ